MGVVGLAVVITFILVCLSSFIHLVLMVYLSVRKRKMKEAVLPPGTLGLPFLGESLQLISAYKTHNPEPFIDNRRLRYGGVFTTHVFGEATVFSTEAEVNRLILQNEGRLFVSDYPTSIAHLLGQHSLVLMKGLQHKRMHSLTMTRLASASFLKTKLFPDVDRLIIRNLSSWDHKIKSINPLAAAAAAAVVLVFLQDETKKMTFDLTVKQLMNLDPGEWTENIRKEYLLMIQGFFSIPISFFPFFTTYARAIKARRRVSEAIRVKVMERRRKEKRSSAGLLQLEEYNNNNLKKKKNMMINDTTDHSDDDDDMMEVLLQEGLSDDEIVDFVLALLVAGYETTSTIMTLAVKFLTENPLALAQLKEEHEEIVRRKQMKMSSTSTDGSASAAEQGTGAGSLQLEWIDYKSNMPFTQCVINETLRVANIISGVFRRAVCDVPIRGGYVIPKGWKVFASFRAVHLDDNNYKDARTFNPWRWQQQKKQGVDGSSSSSSGGGVLSTMFTPFGGGPRLCPGYELGRLQISVFLHLLVTNFSWTAAGEDKLIFFPTTRTLNRYPINVTRISSNNNNNN